MADWNEQAAPNNNLPPETLRANLAKNANKKNTANSKKKKEK